MTQRTRSPLYTPGDYLREASEKPSQEPYRSAWRHDYARLIHSPCFRRLQGKTQLFPGETDFFRNRLTHSLEVAQIAKSIAIRLNHITPELADASDPAYQISPDLVEFAGLAHDLGHPPFGHNGEAALDECMALHGGFEGNAQTLRILARLERKRTENYPQTETYPTEFGEGGVDVRKGLNLAARSLAATLKYNTQIPNRSPGSDLEKGYYDTEAPVVAWIIRSVFGEAPVTDKTKTIECQIMDLADDIAYSTYDLEDSMKAGFTSLLDFLTIDKQPIFMDIVLRVWKRMNHRERLNITPDSIPEEMFVSIDEERRKVNSTF